MGTGGGVQTKVKIPRGLPEAQNQPLAQAPGLLRLVSGLAVFSVVGTMVYAVGATLGGAASLMNEPLPAIYIAFVHLLLPVTVTYTVTMNQPISRYLITLYTVILCSATMAGEGVLGALPIAADLRIALFFAIMVTVIGWLYGAPSMRFYYALIGHKPIPKDLADRAEALANRRWIHPRVKSIIDWTVDHLETVVLLGFLLVAVYAVFFMSWGPLD